MSMVTIVICNHKGCKSRIELGDDPVAGAEEILEIRLADGSRLHFCCIEHLRPWAMSYVCQFKAPKPEPTKAPVAWPKTTGPKQ
jgi:hypothetical protein